MGATLAGLLLIRKNYVHGTGDKMQNDSHSRNLSRPNQFSVSFDSLLSTPNNVVNFSQYSTFIYYILQMSTLNFYHQSHFMLIWQTLLTASNCQGQIIQSQKRPSFFTAEAQSSLDKKDHESTSTSQFTKLFCKHYLI